MGKRLLRELQLQAQRRVAGEGNLLRSQGSPDPDRGLAAALQHRAPTLFSGLPTTCSTNHLARGVHTALLWGGGGMNAATWKPPD